MWINSKWKKIRPSYLSGVSSGALCAIGISAILQAEDQNIKHGFDWNEWKEWADKFKDSNAYDDSAFGLAKTFTWNIHKGYLLDNSPLRKFLAILLKRASYFKFGDLYIPTCITLVNRDTGKNHRFWSTDSRYKDLDLIDMIMATSSFSPIFPTTTVKGLGDAEWIDGGTGIDCQPVYALLRNADLTELYLISYNFLSAGNTLPKVLETHSLIQNSICVLNAMHLDFFYASFNIATQSDVPSFAFFPDISEQFSLLEFNKGKHQYELANDWAKKNNPIMLLNFKLPKRS